MKNQLRRVPDLSFFIDDSLDYIDRIEKELKEGENPLKNITTLAPRQKK
jgi:ribosome-binding factor A